MKKILVVEDEKIIRIMYAEELEDEGYRVVTVSGGFRLLETLQQERPDLVVLDIKLKEEDGLDLLQNIRKEYCQLPVILCSAYSSYRGDPKSIGADDYVVKSANLDELKKSIRICFVCQDHKEDATKIRDLVRKEAGIITGSKWDALYLQAKETITTMDAEDVELILDSEVEKHNTSPLFLSTLRKTYRDMVMRGDISFKKTPKVRDVQYILENNHDLGSTRDLFRSLSDGDLALSLEKERTALSKEIGILKAELTSVLNALKKCQFEQIRNYDNLKHVLTSNESKDSGLLPSQDFKIILEDFYHDLKNSVRSINVLTEDLEDEVDESVERPASAKLNQICAAITQRTRDIAQFVKEMEQLPFVRSLTPEYFNVEARINDIIADLTHDTNVNVELLINPRNLSIASDRTLFTIILKNVIKNALEAMPGGGLLVVKGQREEENVRISVKDSGFGIPSTFMPKVFDLKFSKGKEKGRGMGLYIAKKAIMALGGKIHISSVQQEGTTVSIELPKGA
ncbi:MAG: response regulator [Desulfobacterales bacterium]|nr:response regulator [Desulfobacterales bacterium]